MTRNPSRQTLKDVSMSQSSRVSTYKPNLLPSRNYRGYCIDHFEQEEEEDDRQNSECQILSGLWNFLPQKPVERSVMYSGEYKEVEFTMVEGKSPRNGIKMRSQFKCTTMMQRGTVEFQEIKYRRMKKSDK